ncbi:MAG: hypothetical protein PHX76_02700 [Patescibacteria group bacterium]|jgi:hypothetical protein|nr:hypothetical protein [Patescibacteria group bacterium]MDD3939579.1 hypothetical protein [Patescibacteria group bacterium]MDD4444037.1 hypothetical protein [Patescibacteria group bacterium]NCU39808.1 hypothetical protein [Candidatus Falkowbacteria bacterium]
MELFKRKKSDKLSGALKNPKILEVNLIKEEAQMEFNWSRNLRSLLFALGVTIFVIAEIYYGLDWWQKDEEARLASTQAQIKTISGEIATMRESAKDALNYQEKTKEIGALLENHIYWTNFFTWLEKNTLSTVSFGAFGGDLEGEYSLSGTANTFAEVSWQAKKMLEAPFVKEVDILNASFGETKSKEELEEEMANAENQAAEGVAITPPAPPTVSFTLNLKIDPEIFKK